MFEPNPEDRGGRWWDRQVLCFLWLRYQYGALDTLEWPVPLGGYRGGLVRVIV